MFKLFKPKRSAFFLGSSFAAALPQFLPGAPGDAIQIPLQDLVEKSANAERVRPEFAAFHCFSIWAGISMARQQRKITETGFDDLISGYFAMLEELSAGIDVLATRSLSYSTVWEWLMARIERYVSIATTVTSEQKAVEMIIETFCDFACDGPPSAGLKLEMLNTYIISAGRVVEVLSEVRLESP